MYLKDMPNRNHACVIFVARFSHEYRVIYKSNKEWHVDAAAPSITEARIKAERCMQALYLQSGCEKDTVKIYELNIVSHLCPAMLHGLHNNQSSWQQYMDNAASILNAKENVSMASFVSESNEDIKKAEYDPYLFIISNNMQTGQHYLDTVQLRKKTRQNNMGIIHKISQGKPCLYVDQTHHDKDLPPLAINIEHEPSAAVA
jgi:hypothetical protein